MSRQATDWAFQQDLPAMVKVVLLVLANRHNAGTGRLDPSVETLAHDCGMSMRSVGAAISELEKRKLLKRERRNSNQMKTSNAYSLAFIDAQDMPIDKRQMLNDTQDAPLGYAPPAATDKQELRIKQEYLTGNTETKDSPDCVTSFAEAWNRHCGEKLSQVAKMTDTRKRKIAARCKQGITVAEFARAVTICAVTPFLNGTSKGWRADFDWLTTNDLNIQKVLEGKYGNGTVRSAADDRKDRGRAAIAEAFPDAFRRAADGAVDGLDSQLLPEPRSDTRGHPLLEGRLD